MPSTVYIGTRASHMLRAVARGHPKYCEYWHAGIHPVWGYKDIKEWGAGCVLLPAARGNIKSSIVRKPSLQMGCLPHDTQQDMIASGLATPGVATSNLQSRFLHEKAMLQCCKMGGHRLRSSLYSGDRNLVSSLSAAVYVKISKSFAMLS